MTYKTQTDVDDTGKDGAETGMAPAERIRDLNDELRTTGIGGKTYLTRGMWAQGSDFVAHAVSAVRAFNAFTNDNDPWQEHDCASLDVDGETLMFKYFAVQLLLLRIVRQCPPAPAPATLLRGF